MWAAVRAGALSFHPVRHGKRGGVSQLCPKAFPTSVQGGCPQIHYIDSSGEGALQFSKCLGKWQGALPHAACLKVLRKQVPAPKGSQSKVRCCAAC